MSTSMAEPQDDRVAFEAWMRRTYAHTQLRRSLDGRGYTDRREDFQWAAWQARASTSIPAGEPVAWTLTETLTKRETTTRGHLWFTDPVNSLWTPLYATPPSPPAPKVVPLSDERIDHIAELVIKGMPDGIRGFCKVWGWQQFARALLEVCGPKDDVHQT